MPSKTEGNLAFAFAAESRCAARQAAYAKKAEQEGLGQLARLFRAVAEAESVHARRYLLLLRGKIDDSAANLRAALEGEILAHAGQYQRLAQEAEDEGQGIVASALRQAQAVELRHLELLRQAGQAQPGPATQAYQVCQVCGYVAGELPPESCPICGAVPGRFKRVE